MKITINKTLFVLATATYISLAATSGYAADTMATKTTTETERDADGNYVKKSSVEGEDSNGTATSDTNEVKVKVDADGSYKKTVESKSFSDPEGLGNKSVVESSKTTKNSNGKYEDKTSTETKNGVTGTKTTREASIEVKTGPKGLVERTSTTKVSTDPEGLLNKSTVNTVDKIEKKDGQNRYNYTKKVNGKTVEDKTLKSNN